MARRIFLTIAAALPAAFASASAQASDPGKAVVSPRVDYALTNVRIVTAPGKVIERGTIVTRDGRIAAVGANVNIPAGVVRLDLAGHTVFPGLIDAATSIGLPSPTRALPAAAAADAPAAGRGAGGRGGDVPAGGRGVVLGRSVPPAPPVILPELDAGAEATHGKCANCSPRKTFR